MREAAAKRDGKLQGPQEAPFVSEKAEVQQRTPSCEDILTDCSSSVQAAPPMLMLFEPLTLTFRHLSYYVPMPKVGLWALSYRPH